VAIVLLVGRNLVGGWWLPEPLYVPVNLLLAGLLLGIARRGGAGASELGMRPDRFGTGVVVGVVVALAGTLLVVAASMTPVFQDAFRDDRAAGLGIAGMLYQVLVRIPFGTAVMEEVAFRGVLIGLGRRVWSEGPATVVSAVLFGMWHIAPTLRATTAAGLLFGALRRRADSIVAPIVVHAVVNGAAFVAAARIVGG
jgi:membrane protease YdiL (CAAX protease family)